jgi:hypothetical protein
MLAPAECRSNTAVATAAEAMTARSRRINRGTFGGESGVLVRLVQRHLYRIYVAAQPEIR